MKGKKLSGLFDDSVPPTLTRFSDQRQRSGTLFFSGGSKTRFKKRQIDFARQPVGLFSQTFFYMKADTRT